SEIETTFKLKDFNYDNGHILQDLQITEQIPFRVLENLKESAQGKYIEFNEHPIIEGVIKAKRVNYKELDEIIGNQKKSHQFKKEGLLFLTELQYEEISKMTNISFEEISGAVYPIAPTISFLFLKICDKKIIREDGNRITLSKGLLNHKIE